MAKETDTFDTTGHSAKNVADVIKLRAAQGWKVKRSVGTILILKRKAK